MRDPSRPTVAGPQESKVAEALFVLAAPGVGVRWNIGVVLVKESFTGPAAHRRGAGIKKKLKKKHYKNRVKPQNPVE